MCGTLVSAQFFQRKSNFLNDDFDFNFSISNKICIKNGLILKVGVSLSTSNC